MTGVRVRAVGCSYLFESCSGGNFAVSDPLLLFSDGGAGVHVFLAGKSQQILSDRKFVSELSWVTR